MHDLLYGRHLLPLGQQSMLVPPLAPRRHPASFMMYSGMRAPPLQQQHTTASGQQSGRVDVVDLLDGEYWWAALTVILRVVECCSTLAQQAFS